MHYFDIPCSFSEGLHRFRFYVGESSVFRRPLYYQRQWLAIERGGEVPSDVIDSFENIHSIAQHNKVNSAELMAFSLSYHLESKSIKKIDNNVVFVDFDSFKSFSETTKFSPSLTGTYPFTSAKFLDIVDLRGAQIEKTCHYLAQSIAHLIPPSQHSGFAQHLLSAQLVFLSLYKRQSLRKEFTKFIRPRAMGKNAYFFAVGGDVWGYALSFEQVAAVEFFVFATHRERQKVVTFLINAIREWSNSQITDRLVKDMSKLGWAKKDISKLKKTLKTLIC